MAGAGCREPWRHGRAEGSQWGTGVWLILSCVPSTLDSAWHIVNAHCRFDE